MATTGHYAATPANRTLLQSFEWHTQSKPPSPQETHSSSSHYARLRRLIPTFADLGVTAVWLPPGCKANNPTGNGYDCYDLWDLGEFDQKWARSTKWGSREELDELIATSHDYDVDIIWDAVLNHKTAGDSTEECWAVEVDPDDRRVEICQPKKIEAWLKFDFPGRHEQYSSFKWRAEHFNGTDWDQKGEKHAIFKLIDDPVPSHPSTAPSHARRSIPFWSRILHRHHPLVAQRGRFGPSSSQTRIGKGWARDVDNMHGNNDYLMFSNIDYVHSDVRKDTIQWGKWMIERVGVNGFRLDAAQHFSSLFTRELVHNMRQASSTNTTPQGTCFVVGEVWTRDVWRIIKWLDAVGHSVFAFDSPLLIAFSSLSQAVEQGNKNRADLRKLEKDTLLARRPGAAVTVVSNHDTQSGQASYVPMDDRLKVLFYAYILLRRDGLPCVFWGDLFGISEPGPRPTVVPHSSQGGIRFALPGLLMARKLFAYGDQTDYFDSAQCIAWSRSGTHDRSGCVVMLSIQPHRFKTQKKIAAGRPGQTWIDLLSATSKETAVTIDSRGFGLFTCSGRRAAVYFNSDHELAGRLPVQLDPQIAT